MFAVNKRFWHYLALCFGICLLYIYTRHIPWNTDKHAHTLLEVVASGLALITGTLALIRHHSHKRNLWLLIGAGFIAAGVLDAFHAIFTSALFDYLLPSAPQALAPWSWSASRLVLSATLFYCWVADQREEQHGGQGVLQQSQVFGSLIGLVLLLCLTPVFLRLPRAYFPELSYTRPQEFFSAVLFMLAGIGFWRSGHWKSDALEHWLMLSLITAFFGQALFMATSFALYDVPFSIAHLLKITSYLCILIGVLHSMQRLFRAVDTTSRELSTKNAELEKLTKNKTDFVSIVSHELRTPISITRDCTKQISEGLYGAINPEQKKMLDHCTVSLQRLNGIITDLLDINKIEAGKYDLKPKPTNLVLIANEAIDSFQMRAKDKGIELKTIYDSHEITALADKDKILQVFTNLLANALKFTDQGHIAIHIARHGQTIECRVTDTGRGIPAAELPRVFGRFEQLNNQKRSSTEKGTGLGLAISKDLVEMHGGQIRVESKVGEGASFIFALPIK